MRRQQRTSSQSNPVIPDREGTNRSGDDNAANAPPRRDQASSRQQGRGTRHRETQESLAQVREEFDISGFESPDRPTHRPLARSHTAPIAPLNPQTADTTSTTLLCPMPPPFNSSRPSRNVAHDINHFFLRGDKNSNNSFTICKTCKENHDSDPLWKGPNYTFASSTSNSTLRGHLEKAHCEEYLRLCEEKGWKIQLPKMARNNSGSGTSENIVQASSPRSHFSQQAFLQSLVNFIIANDQSINVVECHEFRELLLVLREDLQDKDIPHRTKIRESILKTWGECFRSLKEELSQSAGKISFTADVWSDQNRRSYICITAHWIARIETTHGLLLRHALIAFHRLRGSHDGKTMAETVVRLLDRAGITANVGHWTLDNAANNKTFMEELGKILEAHDISFDPTDQLVMCFPHVINICCQHVVKSFTNTELADTNDDTLASLPERRPQSQTFDEAVQRDPVALGRNIVRAVRSSGQRRDKFLEAIKGCNRINADNDDQAVKLPELELLRDVKTRWDSIYYMIQRLRILRPAIDIFFTLAVNRDIAKHKMTEMEWEALRGMEVVLMVPHIVQMVMSADSMPILAGAIPSFEVFMTSWETVRDKNPQLKNWIDVGLEWAKTYYERMDRTRAYIIAMFLNPAIRLTWIREHWDQEYILDAEAKIKDLMMEYHQRANPVASEMGPRPAESSNRLPAFVSLAQQYGLQDMHVVSSRSTERQTVEQEFQSYTNSQVSSEVAGIIKFWEVNEHVWPTLFQMAMDYLPIQASAVPSERVFSSSAETDTKKRNRIHPVLMEALQMSKFALKEHNLNFMRGWATPICAMTQQDAKDDDGVLVSLLHDQESEDTLDRIIGALSRDDEASVDL